MLMRADNVTEHELAALIRAVGNKLKRSHLDAHGELGVAQIPQDYRPGVGIMLLNRNNRVFVGGRCKPGDLAWQMPQGGIDPGEDARAAAFRELKEEIGTANAEILAESKPGFAMIYLNN
jgi:putative (di)nucleoside polyphosphate hydrolase